MPITNRVTGVNGSVFTTGGSAFIGDLVNCTFTITNKDEDVKGVTDRWGYHQLVGSDFEITGELFATSQGTTVVTQAWSSTSALAFLGTTGAEGYSGSLVFTKVDHQYNRDAAQKYNFTAMGWGPLTVTKS